jgi:hypothetical protein
VHQVSTLLGWIKGPRTFKALLALAVFLPRPLHAQITRVVIDPMRSEAVEGGKVFGSAGAYERLIGFAYGELDPNDRRNALIQDIQLAPQNARGKVEYVTAFSLIKPADVSKASGLLFYEVVNRGNEGRARDEFLMKRGAVILRSGWQGDIPATDEGAWGGKTYSVRVPVAKNPDGSSITGPVLIQFWNMVGNTSPLMVLRRPTAYRPASMDTRQATLTSTTSLSNDGQMGPVTTVPSTEWAWANCTETPFPGNPDPTKICLKNGFDSALLYQLVFTAKDPLVLGVGFAATRDIVSFFRRATQDSQGTPNPVAGRITRAIGTGRSQTGQYVRTFINLGFNEDLSGRVVWEGAIPDIAGRQLGLNFRFALPDGTATLYVPDTQGALWWSDWEDTLRGHEPAGLLNRCLATNTCPKVFETFGSGEFWGLRMSAGLVGTDGAADIPLPADVRRYYSPGTTHGGGRGGFAVVPESPPSSMMGACTLPSNPNPSSETGRALLVALDEWITRGKEPPPSRYPRLADGTLVPDTKGAMGFPDIPGVPFTDHFANPVFDFDFGPGLYPDDVTGILTKMPPTLKHVIPAMVPKVNADGNEVAGVSSVLHQAPLGTYLGWNITSAGFFESQRCAWLGGFVPFAQTKAERMAAGDPRPSLAERYGNPEGYVNAVRAAAERLVEERFLLREDADRLIRDASDLRFPSMN